jgi:hypothetical protein
MKEGNKIKKEGGGRVINSNEFIFCTILVKAFILCI